MVSLKFLSIFVDIDFMIEEIKNIDISSKRDLDSYLINVSGFMRASKEEKDEWPYKSELAISPINLIGKELFEYNKSVGIVSDINYKNIEVGKF